MKAVFSVIIFAFVAQTAAAVTDCELATDAGKVLYRKTLPPSENRDDTQMIYVRPDGSVHETTWKEIKDRRDFCDLNRSHFFTFKIEGDDHIEIGYGDVNTRRRDVRRLIALVSAQKRVAFSQRHFEAVCLPAGERP